MEQLKCSCERFDKLEGASVGAYIKAFLEQPLGASLEERNLYRCRVCGRRWEKRTPLSKGEGTRPSLVRLSDDGQALSDEGQALSDDGRA